VPTFDVTYTVVVTQYLDKETAVQADSEEQAIEVLRKMHRDEWGAFDTESSKVEIVDVWVDEWVAE
jgi:hypothetical protein